MDRTAPPPLARELFDLPDDAPLWVMHCAEGPVPRAAAEAVRSFLARETRPWTLRWREDFLGLPEAVRREAGTLLGVRPEDVSLVPTTSAGLATVAQGLRLGPGDEVVVPLGEFPANAWPWRVLARRGVGVREVPLWDGQQAGRRAWDGPPPPADVAPEERLVEAIGPRTRVVAASWVRFQDGLRLDLGRLAAGCRARGVAVVIDGIQGAGTLVADLERTGVDAFASGGHKGLLAPQGLGVLWTHAAFRERLDPPGGWLSVEQATDFARPSTDLDRGFVPDGRALELGVPNLVGAAALERSLATLNAAGIARIERHVLDLAGRLLARLARGPWAREAGRLEALRARGRLGSIVALHHGGQGPDGLGARLEQGFRRGIHASVREGYLRIAFHGWHDEADVERLAGWLED
ncbi:MAG: aminotransferase class V-fold PLP-dependent enzyme [Acidobacteriota bacterium]